SIMDRRLTNKYTPEDCGVKRSETLPQEARTRSIEHLDLRTGSGSSTDNELRFPVSIQVSCVNSNAVVEVCAKREEALEQGPVLAAEDFHVGSAAGACPGDDVGEAVAVDVAGGHVDAALEVRIVREETGEQVVDVGRVEDLDVRTAARAGRHDDVR